MQDIPTGNFFKKTIRSLKKSHPSKDLPSYKQLDGKALRGVGTFWGHLFLMQKKTVDVGWGDIRIDNCQTISSFSASYIAIFATDNPLGVNKRFW